MTKVLVPTRRNLLGWTAGAVAAGLAPARAAEKPLPEKVRLYARARGAPTGTRGVLAYTGTLWGKRTYDAAVALFHVEGFSFNRLEMQPDGSLTQKMIEVGFWCDPVTRVPADKWINPLNGLPCAPQHYKSSQSVHFDASGRALRPDKLPEGMTYDAWITDPEISGDIVWIGETIIAKRVASSGAGRSPDPLENGVAVSAQTSLVTYTLHRKDIEAPDSTLLPGTMNFQTLGSWYPWMRMGQESGQIMFQLSGRKLRGPEEMPASLHRLIDDRHPGWLKDPGI